MARYVESLTASEIISEYTNIPLHELVDIMAEVPSEDVEPVIRCKDCKWYKESKLLAPNKFCFRLKDRNGDPIGYNFAPDEFCSFGERKVIDNGNKS